MDGKRKVFQKLPFPAVFASFDEIFQANVVKQNFGY